MINSNFSPTDILGKIPRMRDTTANAVVDFFLLEKLEWERFKNQIDSIHRFGFCVCGLFATDNINQYQGKNTCIYCREGSRQDIFVVPNMEIIRRIERSKPSYAWYHVVNMTNRESEVSAIDSLIYNIKHKMESFNKTPTVRNFLGADALSREIFANIKETLYDKFGNTVTVVDLPLGVGFGDNISKINDNTLFLLINAK